MEIVLVLVIIFAVTVHYDETNQQVQSSEYFKQHQQQNPQCSVSVSGDGRHTVTVCPIEGKELD